MSNQENDKFRILSLCGGGMRGLLSSVLLQRLNKESGGGLLDKVDMYAGTSTGAIISTVLLLGGNLGLDALPLLYETVIAHGFKSGQSNPNKPEIANNDLIREIAAKVPGISGDKALSELEKKVLLTSFHVDSSQEYQPGTQGVTNDSWGMLLFNNFPNADTGQVRLFDATTASGAMPGISGSVAVSKPNPVSGEMQTHACVDGAFVNHDPTLAAISLAVANGYALENISVITIGTGFMRNYVLGDTANWGSEQWLNLPQGNKSVTPPLFVNTQQQTPVLNMTLNGTSTNETPALSSMMLGNRYAYLNPDFGDKYIGENATDKADLDFMKTAAQEANLSTALDVISNHW